MINILVVDDHDLVRQGLKKILDEQDDMKVGGEAKDADELHEILPKEHWDVITLDISLPGKSGIDLLKDVHANHPEIPILLLSMLPEDQFAMRALKAGAAGYLNKASSPGELVKAIRKVVAGRKYVSAELAERLAMGFDPQDKRLPHESLSQREFQVMRELASGKSLSDIASELFVSVKTVATHRARLLEKLNMHTNAELVRYAVEHKLIE
ncbi:MAG TPA: response regulator transcription factor [Bacteroidota bacterium]|nr:response regulator transcription factor [Bacteroidota bacterium]